MEGGRGGEIIGMWLLVVKEVGWEIMKSGGDVVVVLLSN